MSVLGLILMVAASPAISQSSEITVRTDLAYIADNNPSHTLDLYLPQGIAKPPLLVFIHGGAWISGNKKAYAPIGEYFAKRHIATAVVNYRLSRDPAIKHPAPCEDVAAAIHWLQRHATEYGFDSGRTFLLGHSAGAHMEGMFATDSSLLGATKISGFIGLEGIYDIPGIQKSFPAYRDWFLSAAFGSEERWAAASPTLRPLVQRTPWLVIHSKSDELVDQDQAKNWAAHLRKSGVPVELVIAEYGKHFDTVGVFQSIDSTSDEATKILHFIANHR